MLSGPPFRAAAGATRPRGTAAERDGGGFEPAHAIRSGWAFRGASLLRARDLVNSMEVVRVASTLGRREELLAERGPP